MSSPQPRRGFERDDAPAPRGRWEAVFRLESDKSLPRMGSWVVRRTGTRVGRVN